jgi:hypothetical protein
MRILRCTLPFILGLGPATAQSPGHAPESGAPRSGAPDARQIHWQRSVDDALALAKATGRPLLLALNMDGESASDRIVYERYRDPAFVALTRRCVCLGASVFRHNARDHDDQGRRIPCPRFGCITCGEHMALEPPLFERWLGDGDRVAPRHALILPDGRKAWDLSLCFDMLDIDRALAKSLEALPREANGGAPAAADWDALAAARDDDGRSRLEDALLRAPDETALATALDAIARRGDAGAADALRLVAMQLPRRSEALRERFAAAVRALHVEAAAGAMLRDRLRLLPAVPGTLDPAGAEQLLPLLADLDATTPASRTLLLAAQVLAEYGAPAQAAVARALPAADAEAVADALRRSGGPQPLGRLLAASNALLRAPGASARADAVNAGDAMPEAAVLEQTLTEVDAALHERRGDAGLLARYAKASLDLGRRRLEAQQKDAQILLDDAELHWRRALDSEPAHAGWWIERARTAYFLQHFADEVQFGLRALALATGGADGARALAALGPSAPDDAAATEALRWVGDGSMRQLGSGACREAAAELTAIAQGLRALGAVAASPRANANDWSAFASFAGVLGLWREQLAIAFAGARRLPAAPELRQAVFEGAWRGGRVEVVPMLAASIEGDGAPNADCAWFTGFAHLLAAEDRRRADDMFAALAECDRAAAGFARAQALEPGYAANCAQQLALTELDRGFAHARLGHHAAAADALVALVATKAPFAQLRDGLDCDVLDLVDRIFEWREQGPSPVDPGALLTRIERAGSTDPFWPTAIADALLREALRADGRNPDRVERDTVDAGGNRIRMPMGRPTESGDAYLAAARAIARRARDPGDADRIALAQTHAIWAERMLDRDRDDGVAEALAEAAALLGMQPPAAGADRDALRAGAAALRSRLGEARPRYRAGR